MRTFVVCVACLFAISLAAGTEDSATEYSTPALDATLHFLADFQSGPGVAPFVKSTDGKFAGQPVSVGDHDDAGGIVGDKCLHLDAAAQHYGLTAPFESPLDVAESSDFVLQYEVQLTEGLDCGGAYVKVLRHTEDFEAEELTDASPYAIMFGPDKCGATNKVHFILQRQNEVSGKWEEKHMDAPPTIKSDKHPHLYTLAIKQDNTYAVYIDAEEVKSGSLFEGFTPAVNPPEEIDDPEDEKPLDWVDAAKIPDPDAVKPDDWDEDAPATIVDEDATMPEGWLEDAEDAIPDPEAEMPEDWDEDEDGEWEAPMVDNPACETAPGCGPWSQPRIPNPEYKGKWTAPLVDNPDYVGVWAPRKIPNPEFFVDENPHQLPTLAGIAIEIWTMSAGIEFDNVLVTDSVEAALEFGAATWKVKHDSEVESAKAARKSAEKASRKAAFEDGTILDKANYYIMEALEFALDNPVPTVVTFMVLVASLVWCCLGGSGPEPSPIVGSDDEAEESEEEEGDSLQAEQEVEEEEEEEEGGEDQ